MEQTKPSKLELGGIRKSLGGNQVLRGIDLTVEGGELVSLVGPSGCGKTTTLNIIAGFLQPDGGEVRIDGVAIDNLAPYRRGLAMVFQNYSLFPHMTVFDNIAFGLRMRGIPKKEILEQVRGVLELVHLPGIEDRYPRQLSGGQQQRIGLARALAVRPRVLLLDEPLSNLDAKLRKSMQIELRRIQQQVRITAVYVTHDQEEALTLSDRIAVMNAGVIEQIGSPEAVYSCPASQFVGEFIGESSWFSGVVVEERGPDLVIVELAGGCRVAALADSHVEVGGRVRVMVRPDRVVLEKGSAGDVGVLYGRVMARAFLGSCIRCVVELEREESLLANVPAEVAREISVGDGVRVVVRPDDWIVLPAEES